MGHSCTAGSDPRTGHGGSALTWKHHPRLGLERPLDIIATSEAGTHTSAATPVTAVVPPPGSCSSSPVHRLGAAGLTPPRHSRDHGDFWGGAVEQPPDTRSSGS
ncbi:unnamed protein product [Rangifer tarandus platyrhynchus]|uniref:Uncharacterized protein n=1 Tax=Rangifer tarandus platyrhynchus TaxID=3082113 RepID=A0AC59YLG0_RANTA